MTFRYQRIQEHPVFVESVKIIEEKEKDRIFCRHGMTHLIDVARIAYIKALEEKSEISKDIIYAAALLHDIGRVEEYESGKSHNEAGSEKAGFILRECGYTDTEIVSITNAIKTHGHDFSHENASELEQMLCFADKMSRTCFNCAAHEECNWAAEKKNEILIY